MKKLQIRIISKMNKNVIKITDFICNSKMESKVKLIIE
jgi:hypothetical protein